MNNSFGDLLKHQRLFMERKVPKWSHAQPYTPRENKFYILSSVPVTQPLQKINTRVYIWAIIEILPAERAKSHRIPGNVDHHRTD